jgi:hypothetical protein
MLVVALVSCGGGGGGGSTPGTPTGPKISSISSNSAMPTNILTITGTGFDNTTNLSVNFFDNNNFKLYVPVLEAGPTSITVAVPPYVNPSTGTFEPGTVNVQIIQNSGGSIVTSNIINNFQLQDLPTPVAPAGYVTLNTLHGIVDYYVQLQGEIKGTLFDIPQLVNTIDNNVSNLRVLITQIDEIYQNPSSTFTLGTIHGDNVVIGTQALLGTDRMIIGMFQTLSSTSVSAPIIINNSLVGVKTSELVPDPCTSAKDALQYQWNHLDIPVNNTDRYIGYGTCTSYGFTDAYKTAGKVIVGSGAIAIATGGLLGAEASALALPTAALTYAEVMSIFSQINIATAFRNISDSISYRAYHEAIDKIEGMARDLLIVKVIPETGGTLKDIYGGLEDLMDAFEDTAALVPPPNPPTCTSYTYTDWSACQSNNKRSRTVDTKIPAGCTGGNPPVLEEPCTYIPPIDVQYGDYSISASGYTSASSCTLEYSWADQPGAYTVLPGMTMGSISVEHCSNLKNSCEIHGTCTGQCNLQVNSSSQFTVSANWTGQCAGGDTYGEQTTSIFSLK